MSTGPFLHALEAAGAELHVEDFRGPVDGEDEPQAIPHQGLGDPLDPLHAWPPGGRHVIIAPIKLPKPIQFRGQNVLNLLIALFAVACAVALVHGILA